MYAFLHVADVEIASRRDLEWLRMPFEKTPKRTDCVVRHGCGIDGMKFDLTDGSTSHMTCQTTPSNAMDQIRFVYCCPRKPDTGNKLRNKQQIKIISKFEKGKGKKLTHDEMGHGSLHRLWEPDPGNRPPSPVDLTDMGYIRTR